MINQFHPFFPTFKKLMEEVAINLPVYDLGTSQRFAKEIGLVRHIFDESAYFAGGWEPDESIGKDVCDFHCDIQKMTGIPENSVGSVVCLEVLEHVENPSLAMEEMFRILKPGGVCIVAVPFLWAYHGKRSVPERRVFDRSLPHINDNSHTGYGDYWRFTHEGLGMLFSNSGFNKVDVWPIDGRLISRLQLLRLYEVMAYFSPLRNLISFLDSPRLGRSTTLHFARAYKP